MSLRTWVVIVDSFPADDGVGRRSSVASSPVVADEGEEDVLEGRLLLDVLDLGGGQQLLQLGEGAVLDDRALVQDRDPVGELLGLVEVLGGQQHGRAALGELLHRLPHLDARLRVEPGGRLVEEDDRRVADQAHRDVESAAHAARVRRRPAVAGIGEREAGEQVVGDRARVLQVAQLRDQHEVLPAGEHLVDRGELAGQADRLAYVAAAARRRRSRARSRCRRPPSAASTGSARAWSCRRRSSRAGRRCSRRDVEVDAPQHVQVLEGLLDALHPDGGCVAVVIVRPPRSESPDGLGRGARAPCRSTACRSTPAANVSANSTGSSPTISSTGVPSAAARSHRSAKSPNIVIRRVAVE